MSLLAQTSTQQLVTSSITAVTAQFQTLSTQTFNVSSINGIVPGAAFSGSTTALSTGSVYASNVVVKKNGNLTSNVYGPGFDALSIQSPNAGLTGGIASLYFGASNANYPLARIGAIDQGSAYANSALVFQTATPNANSSLSGSTVYNYTGADQTYTVPAGVTSISVYLWGAGGGTGNWSSQGTIYFISGGAGAMVQGTLAVTPGQVLTIGVGQGGSSNLSATYGGGGSHIRNDGASGGGRSFIALSGNDLVTAGGGGGAGFNSGSQTGPNGIAAVILGTTNLRPTQPTNCVAGSGTQSAGGQGGTGDYTAGNAGTQYAGGSAPGYGGGGGGGYWGGGGGSADNNVGAGGGGGGSSYIANLASPQTYISPNQSAMGAGATAPNTASPYYTGSVGVGGNLASNSGAGGNGLIVISVSAPYNLAETMRISKDGNLGVGTSTPTTLLDVAGAGRFQSISTLSLQTSTINGLAVPTQFVGSTNYISAGLVQTQYLSTYNMTAALASFNSVSTNSLQSPFVSTQAINVSSINGIIPGAAFSGSTISLSAATINVSTLNSVYFSSVQGYVSSLRTDSLTVGGPTGYVTVQDLTTGTVSTGQLVAGAGFISSLQINTLSFGPTGYVIVGNFIANTLSTTKLNAQSIYGNNVYVGNVSSQSAILFPGIDGNYRGTAIAEQTTGVGTQELLLYKVSSTTDQIRLQTTGNMVFEVGAPSRSWNSTTQLATPSLYIAGSTSNVGIGTNTPATTFDVVGTGRFQILSSLSLNVSSINGAAPGGTFNGSTLALSTALVTTSTLKTNVLTTSSALITLNGSAAPTSFGLGVDTMTLQANVAYTGGVASLAFAAATAGYPLGRIYMIDSASSGPAVSQMVFQTVPVSATSFSSNYSYTGANQTFTVPAGVTTISVAMWGGGGGGGQNSLSLGGAGAFLQGTLSVTPGQTLALVVGQGGIFNQTTATYGGGGATGGAYGYSSAGGGRSAIQLVLSNIISGASVSGANIVYTTSSAHGLLLNQPVVITGLSTGFNGNYAVLIIGSTTQFTVSNTTSASGSSTGTGTLYAELVDVGGGGGGGWTGTPNGWGGAGSYTGSGFTGAGAVGYGGGGTQTSGGTAGAAGTGGVGYSGSILAGGQGGNYASGGGGGYYGGGGAGNNTSGGGAGGGSSYTSYTGFTLITGSNSANGNSAPATGYSGYQAGVAAGGATTTSGGPGLILLASIGNALAEAMRIGSNGYVGIGTTAPTTTLDVAGTGRFQILSTLALNVSTINGAAPWQQSYLTSTVQGLGLIGYVSSQNILSTVQGLTQGLGTAGYISSSQLLSTVIGLGSLGYISSPQLASTVRGLTITATNAFTGSTTSLSAGTIFVSSLSMNTTLVSTMSMVDTTLVSTTGTVNQQNLILYYNNFPFAGTQAWFGQMIIPPGPPLTAIYPYTGSAQTWVVPIGVNSINAYMWAAGGGGVTTASGGAGAFIQAAVPVTPGETLTLIVGGGGGVASTSATYGGGGAGGGGGFGTQGGGRTAIQRGSLGATDYITVGAGGGGSGYSSAGAGGAGGVAAGSPAAGTTGLEGQGGTQAAGGAGSAGVISAGAAGTAGAGGAAGAYGGGGGSGYYGGGGSGATAGVGASGGGGSSFVNNVLPISLVVGSGGSAPNTASQFYVAPVAAGGTSIAGTGGNGLIVVSYTAAPPAAPSGLTLTLNGSTATLSWTSAGTPLYYWAFYGNSVSAYTGTYLMSGSTAGTSVSYSMSATYFDYFRLVSLSPLGCISQIVSSPIIQVPAPTGLTITALGTAVTMSWTAVSGATGYAYTLYSNTGYAYGGSSVATGSVGTNTATYSSGVAGTYYYFTVSATTGYGTSLSTTSAIVQCSAVTSISATGGTQSTSPLGYTVYTFTSSDTWVLTSPASFTAQTLVVGGGGAGGGNQGGAGGAGAALYNSSFAITSGSYSVTVGLGGATTSGGTGQNGASSIFSSLTAIGGGGGGTWRSGAGGNGGCGGSGSADAGVSGTATVGFIGGACASRATGGGGGMGSVGSNASGNYGGAGGLGVTYTLGGTAYLVCGGGGGQSSDGPTGGGAGGSGIGGTGGSTNINVTNATNPTPNTGSGGGGGNNNSGNPSAGASGIVVIAIPIQYTRSPTNLVITPAVGNTATLSWTASAGATGYNWALYRSSTNGYFGTSVSTGSTSSTVYTATVTGLNYSYYYYFTVIATGSPNSAAAVSGFMYELPDAPSGLSCTTTGTAVNMSWSATSGALYYTYTVYQASGYAYSGSVVATANNGTSLSATYAGTITNYYYFTLSVTTANGTSALSTSGIAQAVARPSASGGTLTTVSGYSVYTFSNVGTTSFTLTYPSNISGQALVVGGGGGGGGSFTGGGGGAGGAVFNSNFSVTGTITVTVGGGGASSVTDAGSKGGDSVFGSLTGYGGGGGGDWTVNSTFLNGGCGGGGGGSYVSGCNAGTGSQGYNGGVCGYDLGTGGGGGMGSAGSNGASYTYGPGGAGGSGFTYTIATSNITVAGGGGGGTLGGAVGGIGGSGIGGNGGGTTGSIVGAPGAANTGSGGGGSPGNSILGGSGGSGIVIFAIPPISPPTNPTLVSSGSSATMSWTAVSGATGYSWILYQSATNNYAGTSFATGTTTSATTATATGLSVNYYYYFTVATTGPTSPAVASAIVFQLITGPATATLAGSTALSLTWGAVSGATSYTYTIYSGSAYSYTGMTFVTSASTASASATYIGTTGTYYYFTVTATTASGTSAPTTSGLVQIIAPAAISYVASNAVVTQLKDNTSTAISFANPRGVAQLSNGNIIVGESGAHRIRMITPAGVMTTLAGSGTAGSNDGTGTGASFNTPVGVAQLPNGSIVVGDEGNNRIRLIDPTSGVVTTLAGSGTPGFADGTGTSASFNIMGRFGLATSNIIVGDAANNRIRQVTLGGVVTTLAGNASSAFADGTGAAASFSGPRGSTYDPTTSNIFVADANNGRIRIMTLSGVVTTLAGQTTSGSNDGTGAAASFNGPSGVSFIASSTSGAVIAIADGGNCRIRLVTYPGGVVTTLAGSGTNALTDGTGTAASFSFVSDLTVLSNGNILVGDAYNGRVRLISFPTAPTAPTSPTLSITSGTATLGWTAASGATGYNWILYRSATSNYNGTSNVSGSTTTTAPTSAPTGLSSGYFWYYTVASSNASGSSAVTASSVVSY